MGARSRAAYRKAAKRLTDEGAFHVKRQIDIERLLQWAYLELDKSGSTVWSPWDFISRLGKLGTRIDDQFGAPFRLPAWFGDTHPDARIVGRAVQRLEHPACALVEMHGRANSRPKAHKWPPSVKPVMDGSRYLIVAKSHGRSSKGKWRYNPDGAYCMLRYEPTVEQIEASRTEYRAWRYGLVCVARRLLGQLRDYEPIGPAAPLEPWNEPVNKAKIFYVG